MMDQPVMQLLKNGSLVSIFLAVLLIAIVTMANFGRKMVIEQLKSKDERIAKLELEMKEIQHFIHSELIDLIRYTQKIIQKNNDSQERTQERIEVLIKQTNKN